MTDEEVIKVIAERDGWQYRETEEMMPHFPGGMLPVKVMRWFVGPDNFSLPHESPPDYLNDRNSLAPVLAGLSDREWERLVSKIEWNHPTLMPTEDSPMLQRYKCIRHVLTLPPNQLAHAIAESIKGAK